MKITQAKIDEILTVLAETPKRFTAVTQQLTTEQIHTAPDNNSWSISYILAHLRACVDVWVKDIDIMLTQDTPTIRQLSPRTYLRKTNYPELSYGPSFQIFCQQRDALLQKLHALSFADWACDAEIKGRQHTVFSHMRRLALHEAVHCEQIEALQNDYTKH